MQTLTRQLRTAVMVALGLSLFWVIFCWGIWERGPWAMGLNYFVFTLGIALFFSVHAGERKLTKRHLRWLIPIVLISVSFILYENPFIKAVSVPVLVALFALSRIAIATPNYEKIPWHRAWTEHVIRRFLGVLLQIGNALEAIVKSVIPFDTKHIRLVQKIVSGLAIFIVLAALIFIPLLGSADPAFAQMMQSIVDYLQGLLSIRWLIRAIFFVALSIALMSMALSWNKPEELGAEKKHWIIDDVVSGVVLTGILLLYLLFLGTQLRSLWVGTLPAEFIETEMLVKSGFWQLFVLTAINVLLFFVYYRRTGLRVQRLLQVFTVASLLLLFSAAKRMGMYVWFYGFSYEKFFAMYTVLFAVILFGYLLWALTRSERQDVLKFLVDSFIWMYAIVTVLPTEQFIFRANAWLSGRPDSRIDMRELQMLSSDVYGLVLREHDQDPQQYWVEWLQETERRSLEKPWYEWNVQDVKLRAMDEEWWAILDLNQ